MLITNLWTEAGLTNGLRGTLHDNVCLRDPWQPGNLPECSILRIEHEWDAKAGVWRSPVTIKCCLPALSEAEAASGRPCTYVPIPAVERTWKDKPTDKQEHARKMIPLVLCWAIIIHKSQGATLACVVLDVGLYEKHLGIFFVGISRVRKLEDLAFAHPLDGERLLKVTNHAALPFRKCLDMWFASLEDRKLLPWLAAELGVPPGDAARELERTLMPFLEQLANT